MKRTLTGTLTAALLVVCLGAMHSPAQDPSGTLAGPRPLLLERVEGEQRAWRDPPPGSFSLMVSPGNSGSQHLVAGVEDLLPGDEIPRHKHLGQDEIVFIQSGTVHVHLGDRERDLHTGGMVFIPAYTWISFKNTSAAPVSIMFVFSAPGFENHLRCVSVPAGQKPTPLSAAEEKQCDQEGHVIFQEAEPSSK